jgi:hypothetical protein
MSVTAEVVLTIARTYLNDDAATLWQDQLLFPKLQQAHREMQQLLKSFAVPVMRTMSPIIEVLANATTLTLPSNVMEPIQLWETSHGGDISTLVPMTEADPLPFLDPNGNSLGYWQWADEIVSFIGCTANRDVVMKYWRQLNIPQLNTDLVGFLNAEMYLGPRTAALAAISTGNQALHDSLSGLATQSIATVSISNRGRAVPVQGPAIRP